MTASSSSPRSKPVFHLLLLVLFQGLLSCSFAFQTPQIFSVKTSTTATANRATTLFSSPQDSSDKTPQEEVSKPTSLTVKSVIQDKYPDFYALLTKNENIFDQLEKDYGDTGYTLFAPNQNVFDKELTEKQQKQLDDPRNLETAQKMGLYHCVGEPLSITQLNREDWTVPKTPEGLPALKFSALVTLGGEVPIGRTKKTIKGNILRSLINKPKIETDSQGKPVTQIVVGPAGTILRSLQVGKTVIHEVDSLVSPVILWRYCDQLRIPGF